MLFLHVGHRLQTRLCCVERGMLKRNCSRDGQWLESYAEFTLEGAYEHGERIGDWTVLCGLDNATHYVRCMPRE